MCKKADLACVKSDVDKLDVDKFKTVPARLNNLNADVGKLRITKLTWRNLVMLKIMALWKKEDLIGQIHTCWIRK